MGKARMGKKDEKQVRKIVQKEINKKAEHKFHITSVQSTVDDVGYFYDLSDIAQGTTDSTRVGDSISPVSLQIKYDLGAVDAQNRVRVMLVRWLDTSPITINDILLAGSSTYRVYSSYTKDNRQKFNVLYDKTHMLQRDTSEEYQYKSWSKKMAGKIRYTAGTSLGADHIYLFLLSDSGAISHPVVNFYSRLNYIDL